MTAKNTVALIPALGGGKGGGEKQSEASLVYKASSRVAIIQRNSEKQANKI